MNMILHDIEAPNIIHTNTLAENISDIQDRDRFDVILANPPFGGKERPEVQQNFPIKTGETAFLFSQHFIKHLKAGPRPAKNVVALYNKRGTCEQWIKEGKGAIRWTRL
jgi:type I restriction enzyme M protein